MACNPYDEKEQIQIKILNNIINLDEPCWKCVGSYSPYNYDEPRRVSEFRKGYENNEHCDHCDNLRFILTDTGRSILNLIRRHGNE